MADIVFKAPSGPVNSFCLAADAVKFSDMTNFKGVVKKLAYMSEAPYSDNYDSDPEAGGRAVEAGWCAENDFTWDAGNAREKCDSTGECREFLSYDGLGSNIINIDAKLLISPYIGFRSHNACGVAARVHKTNKTGYFAGVHYRTDAAAINISIERDETVLDITGNLSNVARRIHFLHVGNVLKLKYWTDGDAEPTTGGPDDDGYQLKATDDTYASGYFGIFTKNYDSARWRYVDELYVIFSKCANDSPALYTVFDTGKNNRTISAGDKIKVKHTLDSVAGGGKFKIAMNNTLKDGSGGDSDCTTIDTWLNAAWLEVDGSDEITAPENIAGRYLYIVRQFNSDGSQQSNWGMWGGAVQVSIADKVAVDVQGNISDVTPAPADTLLITGNVQSSADANVTLTVKIKKKSDNSLIATVFNSTVDLTAGANDIPTLCGGACQWTVDNNEQENYVEIKVDDGTTDILLAETDKCYFEVIADAGVPSKPAITGATPASAQVAIALTAADESDTIYARYRTPGNAWSAENESFKVTGSGTITITGLTNGTLYEIGIYAKSGDLTSTWDFTYSTPTTSIDSVENEIFTELDTRLPGLGVEDAYVGRSLPKRRKSPYAAVVLEAKTPYVVTNIAVLNEYQINVFVGTDHKESHLGQTEKTRANKIAEDIRTFYNHTRDFDINHLHFIKAVITDIDTVDTNLVGYTSNMTALIQISFFVWEANR